MSIYLWHMDKPSVLIIEDDAFIADIMLQRFSTFFDARRVDTLADGRELLNKYETRVLFLDLHLPDGNGLDLLAELREDPRFAQVLVIILSNDSEQEEQQRGLALGARKYYIKATADFEEIAQEVLAMLTA